MLFNMSNQTYQLSLDDLEGDLYDGEFDEPRPFIEGTVPVTKLSTLIIINPSPSVYLDQFVVTSIPIEDVPGDTDGNGIVDQFDAHTLAAHWLQYNPDFTNEEGDFNGDGHVDDLDASILAANWDGITPEGTAVPEPSTLVMLLTLAAGLLLKRRK
ncbi:MAG: PEP-CTERM sorting domain-containing protein [Pirellulales bacterium]|nr:PEP-CTERM sorting domain-containing protein [Pirellulales bacterium]